MFRNGISCKHINQTASGSGIIPFLGSRAFHLCFEVTGRPDVQPYASRGRPTPQVSFPPANSAALVPSSHLVCKLESPGGIKKIYTQDQLNLNPREWRLGICDFLKFLEISVCNKCNLLSWVFKMLTNSIPLIIRKGR